MPNNCSICYLTISLQCMEDRRLRCQGPPLWPEEPLSCWALMMVTTGNLAKSPYRIRCLSHSVNIGKEKGWEGMCTMKRWMDTLRKRRCYAETRFKHKECSSRALQKLLLRALKSIQSKRFKIWAFILLANGPYLLYVSSPPVYITWRYSSQYHTQPQFYQAWGKFLR